MSETKHPPLLSIGPRVRKSPYFDATLRYGATAFTVYNHTFLPASYGDNVRDYWSLVNDVTLWDVACQRQVQVTGPDAFEFIQFLTPRDMSKCAVGQCRYMVLTNEAGGIVNDAILLRVQEDLFWLSPGDGDVLWWAMGVAVNSGMDVAVSEPDVSPLQLQGPKAPLVARALFGDWPVHMKYYHLRETDLDGIPLVVSRTGWSGELGYELYLRDGRYGDELWERIMAAGKPHGIRAAAPSTIRSIEGGLLSYVSDITVADNPYVIGMGHFVDFEQPGDFIGKAALAKIAAAGPDRKLAGIEIDGPPLDVPNEEFWDVRHDGDKVGHVTRCAYSPRLECNIGWANIPVGLASTGAALVVDAPAGARRAVVCDAPWFRPQLTIPDEMKA